LLDVAAKKRDKDKVALIAFGRDVRVLADFDSGAERFRAAIAALRTEPGDFPRMYKAVDRALKLFAGVDAKFPERRRVLVVAQGKNPSPDAAGTDAGFQASDVITEAAQMGIPVDTVAVPAPPPAPNDQQRLAQIVLGSSGDALQAANFSTLYLENMERLASKTGGMYFVEDYRKRTDLGQHLSDGFTWLMSSPVFKFPVQSLAFDGAKHPIAVRPGNGAADLPSAVLLWQDEGFRQFLKKYGLYLLGGLVALVIVLVALQSKRQPARPMRGSMTPPPATPRPGPQSPESSMTPRPPGGAQPGFNNPMQGMNMPQRPAPNPARARTVPDPAPPRRAGTVVVQSAFPPPAPGRPSCRLVVISGTHATTSFPIEAEHSLLGRGPENAIACVFDPAISNPHAEIRFQGGLVLLVDLNSSNGTFLNGERLNPGQPRSLSLGDRIHMGQTDFQVA
jgi:hypothetical protein